jgi:hypothetical protein
MSRVTEFAIAFFKAFIAVVAVGGHAFFTLWLVKTVTLDMLYADRVCCAVMPLFILVPMCLVVLKLKAETKNSKPLVKGIVLANVVTSVAATVVVVVGTIMAFIAKMVRS